MKRYNGNTGLYEVVPDAQPVMPTTSPPFGSAATGNQSGRSGQSGQSGLLGELGGLGGLAGLGDLGGLGGLGGLSALSKLGGLGGLSALSKFGGLKSIGKLLGIGGSGSSGIGGILSKFDISSLELEDLILIAIFYLLYRESSDIEFLLMAGAMLFL